MAQSVGAIALDIVMGQNTVTGVARQAMADVQRAFNDGTSTIGNKVSAVGSACKNVGASLMPISVGAQATIKTLADMSMSFETAMAQVETIAGKASVSYQGNMMDMSEAIMKLSKDTGISAEEIAMATYSAISAGADVSESVEMVATANALAVGGFTDINTSVDVLTTTLNSYGEKAGTAESISDKLIMTQNLGKTTVNELASSMGKVIPTASAYGISVDNLCSSYVALTKGGIATSEATTYMKSMFNELGNSGSTVGKILQEETGKSFGQLMAEGKSLGDVIAILGEKVGGDTEQFAQLWGSSEAGTGALAILNGGVQDFNNTMTEMSNSTGSASSAMDKMNDTSAHKMQVAMNDMKNAAIELGGAFAPVMSGLASVVSSVASAFSSLPAPAQQVIAVILGIVAVVGPLVMGIGTIISVVGGVISAVGAIQGAMAGFSAFISGSIVPALSSFFTFLMANPIVLVIGAIIAIGALLITHWDEVKQFCGQVWDAICGIFQTVWEGIKNVVTTVIEFIGNFIQNYFNFWMNLASTIWNGIKNAFTNALNGIKTVITNVFNFIKNIFVNYFNFWKNLATTVWTAIKDAFTKYLNMIKTVVATVLNAVKNFFTNTLSNIKNGVVNIFTNIVNGVKNKMTAIFTAIKSGFNKAVSFITGLKQKALTWGRDIIMGIVNGIKSCIGKVGDAVKSVADKIKSFLHFSVPDEGPLTDYESWMPDFIDGMVNGIDKNKYKLIDSVKGMATEMTVQPIQSPLLRNVGGANTTVTEESKNDKIIELLEKILDDDKPKGGGGDITIPIYLGNDLIDEQIVKSNDRRTIRSGGRA